MHAEVQDGVGTKLVGQPMVEGCILRMGCEIPLKQQAHGIALNAQSRLHAYPHIAQLYPTHHQLPCAAVVTHTLTMASTSSISTCDWCQLRGCPSDTCCCHLAARQVASPYFTSAALCEIQSNLAMQRLLIMQQDPRWLGQHEQAFGRGVMSIKISFL